MRARRCPGEVTAGCETTSAASASKPISMSGREHKSVWTGLCLGVALLTLPLAAVAQMHHVDAPQRVTRAIGVYEWTGDLSKPTAARFVPVSLFIDGQMQDAGLYLARPVPFALQPGDVYALEHAGEPEGLLDLDYAQHVVMSGALAADDPSGAWYGFGRFTPEAAPRVIALHASSHLPVIQADGKPAAGSDAGKDDSQPHMSRRGASASTTPTSGSGSSGSPAAKDDGSNTSGSGSGGASTSASGDDTDRPTLRHRDPSQDAARRREYGTKSKQASVTSAGPAPGDDPDRPVLGRSTAADNGTPPLTGLPADLHQAVAVSDPLQSDHHDFARGWDSPAERQETMVALEALAQPRVLAYLKENRLVPSSAPLPLPAEPVEKPAATSGASQDGKAQGGSTTGDGTKVSDTDPPTPPKLERGVPTPYQGGRVAPAKPTIPPSMPAPATATSAPATAAHPASRPGSHRTLAHTTAVPGQASSLKLTGGQISGFTLSYGGLPTFVYTSAASVIRAPGPSGSGASVGSATVPTGPSAAAVFITIVAQRLPSGGLQVALSDVTDSLHLDRGPRLRLIDAVDPDDSHRASLLFELRGATSRQFALYRLTSVQAEQTFTTASIE